MKSYGTAIASLCVAFLVVGLVWPHLAETALRVLVAALAVAYVAARAYRSDLPTSLASDSYSPFDGASPSTAPSSSPTVIDNLAVLLRGTEDPEAARRVPIPVAAHRIVAAEVSRRLEEHHGLGLSDPADHPRVRALVSEATWELIRPAANGLYRDPVRLEHLENILDDVERL